MDASCKKSLCMTSYGGIIRIRLKGRRSYLPLSLYYKLPCIYFLLLYICFCKNTSYFPKTRFRKSYDRETLL